MARVAPQDTGGWFLVRIQTSPQFGPVVQRIEHEFPKLTIQVRFLLGLLIKRIQLARWDKTQRHMQVTVACKK